jgi:hypothetical protein
VRRWHRDGLLQPGRTFSWTWSCDGEPLGEIGVAVEADAVLLTFDWRPRGTSEWTHACQRVPVVWTRCHLGGVRPWFLCPDEARAGKCCGRRVAKLYAGDSHLFACRRCRGLVYASQSENRLDRSIRRARKIRMGLGGGPSLLEPIPDKPPKMHRLTYYRLFGKAAAAQERWIGLQRDFLSRHHPGVTGGR